jgi:ketol-acid reductoisomerase
MPKRMTAFLLLFAGTLAAHAGPLADVCQEDGGTPAQCTCFEQQVQSDLTGEEQDLLVGMMNQDMEAIMKMADSEGMMERMEAVMNSVAAACS